MSMSPSLRGALDAIGPEADAANYEAGVHDWKYQLYMRRLAEAQRDALLVAFSELIHDAQEWCNAVDKDSSWDGWDDHYKALAYGGLDEYREFLAKCGDAP
jgi:hypothetical protein